MLIFSRKYVSFKNCFVISASIVKIVNFKFVKFIHRKIINLNLDTVNLQRKAKQKNEQSMIGRLLDVHTKREQSLFIFACVTRNENIFNIRGRGY